MNTNFIERNYRLIQGIVFLIGLGLHFLYANNQILTGDQLQMLNKGYLGAFHGVWLPFGNAASAVGNVPGYLSSWLVGVPLLIWNNPWAPMLLLIAMKVSSLLLLADIIKKVFNIPTNLLFWALYWLNPWLLYDSLIYNPAYLCFFTALHFWTAFKIKDKASLGYSLLHVLAIGGAMQLHYSWPVLATISCYLLYRKMVRPYWIGVISGMVILLISLIPYFQEYRMNKDISRETDRYIGYGLIHIYPVFKALIYWFRYSSTLYSNRIITDASFDWLSQISWIKTVIQYIWQVILFTFGAVTLLLSIKINWQSWKAVKTMLKRSETIDNDKQWLLLFATAAVISIILNAMLSPITFSYWHLILTFPLALIPLLLWADKWQSQSPEKFFQLLPMLIAFFITVNLIAANGSDKYSYQVNYSEQVEKLFVKGTDSSEDNKNTYQGSP